MGLAASQARYLALTARKSDLEFQSQTINTRRIQLAYRTAEIAQAYTDGMNNKSIQMSQKAPDGSTVWSEITFASLKDAGYVVIPVNGGKWSDGTLGADPYTYGTPTTKKYYSPTNPNASITKDAFDRLSDKQKCAYQYNVTDEKYYPVSIISDDIYNALTTKTGWQEAGSVAQYTSAQVSLNRNYGDGAHNMDLQSLLTSGKAQIVTLEFYSFLRSRGYDPSQTAISPEQFKALQEEWDNSTDETINPGGIHSIYDWRADEQGKFKQKTNTEDDAAVLAKYEADTAEVQAQDKILEAQEKNIETQHKAIETELEAIQKVIQNNIDKTFKIFS